MRVVTSRRLFLKAVAAVGWGCGGTPVAGSSGTGGGGDGGLGGDGGAGGACGNVTSLGQVPFTGESEVALDTLFGQGLDARLYTDLAPLADARGGGADALITPNERFYVRTKTPDRIAYDRRWTVRVEGRVVGEDLVVGIDELLPLARPMPATLLECSGNAKGASFGLMSVARWTGFPLVDWLDTVSRPSAARILVSGFDDHSQPSERSDPGASWIFTREELIASGAFLATTMNDAPLPREHGYPLRLVVPGWYGCTCIKWVDRVRFVPEEEPATAQMREFASRTHQDGEPTFARAYRPATIDLAAMPVRIDRLSGEALLVTGIYWGGDRPGAAFELAVGGQRRPVTICGSREGARTWGLWACLVEGLPPGEHTITLHAVDPTIPTKRLDAGYYARTFVLAR